MFLWTVRLSAIQPLLILYFFFAGIHVVAARWTIYKYCKTKLVQICTKAKSCKGRVEAIMYRVLKLKEEK